MYVCKEVPLHACVTGTHTCGPSESLSLQVRWSSEPDYKMSALPLYATVVLLAKVMPNNSKPSPNTSYTDSYYMALQRVQQRWMSQTHHVGIVSPSLTLQTGQSNEVQVTTQAGT